MYKNIDLGWLDTSLDIVNNIWIRNNILDTNVNTDNTCYGLDSALDIADMILVKNN